MNEYSQNSKVVEVKKITGCGAIDCLRALKRTEWDIPNAVKYLCEENENTIEIGQIQEIYKDNKFPSIKELINRPILEKKEVIEYMRQSKVEAVAPAIVTDLINPEIRFAELYHMTDGKYSWRSDVIYYFEKYDMELPKEFIQHALKHL